MNGRLEHELKINNNIKNNLKDLPEYVNQYYLHIQASKSPITCFNYIMGIKRFIEHVNYKDINQITEEEIQQYLESIKFVNKNGDLKKSSVSYIKLSCSILNSFFVYIHRKGIITTNPMEFIERPSRKDEIKRDFLSMEDLNKVLTTVKTHKGSRIWESRDYAILYLFMVTGMRNSALTEINIDAINWEENTLTIIDKRDKQHIYYLTEETKEILLDWLNNRNQIIKNENVLTDALFISKKRTRISKNAIYELVKRYTKDALGKEYSPHKLRAAFVSLYYDKTKDIEATRRAVGHSSVNTTSLYITMKNDAREDAARFMSDGLKVTKSREIF